MALPPGPKPPLWICEWWGSPVILAQGFFPSETQRWAFCEHHAFSFFTIVWLFFLQILTSSICVLRHFKLFEK